MIPKSALFDPVSVEKVIQWHISILLKEKKFLNLLNCDAFVMLALLFIKQF